MLADLRTKAAKYESKTAECKALADKADGAAKRRLYDGLADYYGDLAADFRQVIEKQKAGIVPLRLAARPRISSAQHTPAVT